MKHKRFKLICPFKPAGDQPHAIQSLVDGIAQGQQAQTLLGVTGSGKTFTIANVIMQVQKPTLILAHNKTLAAQLAQELRSFFPKNKVCYFVSYYDYYQPEAYLPETDTYIEKEADINEEIDRLRHEATAALLTRNDVIVVASVSAIYGLGSPAEYQKQILELSINQHITRDQLIRDLVSLQYVRSLDTKRGTFSVRANTIDIAGVSQESILCIKLNRQTITSITIVDVMSGKILEQLTDYLIFPAKHFVVSQVTLDRALIAIEQELAERIKVLEEEKKFIEADRLRRRTKHDLAMIKQVGYCSGIENYSRHLTGRSAGEPPSTLIDFFPKDFLVVIDESHVTVPQIRGMLAGDQARKNALIEHGFRLPSARDNRPLSFDEFNERVKCRIYLSATPGQYELDNSDQVVEQIIRPTGLVDPELVIKPATSQIENALGEIKLTTKKNQRVLVTILTKKMAEDLAQYLKQEKIKAEYLHSEVDTIDRIRILDALRKGNIEVLVGVNLLREGLDLPEVSLILILDADKEGFLRSETSLIQTIGRAARHVQGRVILYADEVTGSMQRAIQETARRRQLQLEYNRVYNITPRTIKKRIGSLAHEFDAGIPDVILPIAAEKLPQLIQDKEDEMKNLAKRLHFEEAALVRDELVNLKKLLQQSH